jgi:putative spermidine/putrescine transport system permease protein
VRSLRLSRVILVAYGALVVAFLVAPTLLIVAMSFGSTRSLNFPPEGFSLQWYRNFFNERWLDPTVTSLKVAALASLLATILGTLAALGTLRGRFPGRQVAQALLLAPLIVPVVIVAIGLYLVFSRWHMTGFVGLVLGHTILAIPFVLITVGASLQTVDPVYERAAANLGAGPFSTFFRVTLPLILPGVLAGALFAFVTSLDEVVIAIFLTTPTALTLPVEMWATIRDFIDPTMAAISSMLLGVTVLVLLGSLLLGRRGETVS